MKTPNPVLAVLLSVLFGSAGFVAYQGSAPENNMQLEISGPESCATGELIELQATGNAKLLAWNASGGMTFLEFGKSVVPRTVRPGIYEFQLAGYAKNELVIVTHVLQVGPIGPQPDPGPTPIPVPVPDPVVTTGPVKILIVEETNDRLKKENAVYNGILSSVSLRKFVATKVVPQGADKFAWFQVWDKDATFAAAPNGQETPQVTFWKAALALPHTDLPWINIFDGKTDKLLFGGKLPDSEQKVIDLITKYTGK